MTPTVATPETTESSSESSATEATVEPIGDTTQAGEIKSAVEIGH